MLATRPFGQTEIQVPVLGLGAGLIGDIKIEEDFIGQFLNRAVDMGYTLIDTARGYGASEDRIGRHLSWRRKDLILSTKVGYGVDFVADWTEDCVRFGVDRALWQLQTDYIDIVHLHSCDLITLQHGEVIRALEDCKKAGKVRAIAYSGENEALAYAAQTGVFDSLMCSINLYDQQSLQTLLPAYPQLGVIAKRALANAPWRFSKQPIGDYAEAYWKRAQAMQLELMLANMGMSWGELALRFAAFNPVVDCAITGSLNLEHLERNQEWVANGPLPEAIYQAITERFIACGEDWQGEV